MQLKAMRSIFNCATIFGFVCILAPGVLGSQVDNEQLTEIVGGTKASIHQFPWLVSVQYNGVHICGGSIVAQKFILTAAHCVPRIISHSLTNLTIRAGSANVSSGGWRMRVKRIHVHPKFDKKTLVNDLAILELHKCLHQFSVIRLAGAGANLTTNTKTTVAGWGLSNENVAQKWTPTLQSVALPIVNLTLCKEYYRSKKMHINDQMLCAGFDKGGKDACQGDSGGSMTVNRTLFGVVSTGYGCGLPYFPGVYVRVSSYRYWIDKRIRVKRRC